MDTFSGLNQPGINLGGLLNMGGLSGAPGTMGTPGAQPGGPGGIGMTGGMDLAELLKALGEGGGDAPAVGMNQQLGTLPTSLAQQQALGQAGFQQQPYLTAGGMGQQGGGGGMAAGSPDPLALIQKFLGLAQKGAGLTGLSQQSLLPSPSAEGQQFDPTGQMQQQGVQEFRAGERGDFGGFDLNAFQQLLSGFPQPGAGLVGEVGAGLAPPSDIFNPNFMGGGPGGVTSPGSSIDGNSFFGAAPQDMSGMLSFTDNMGNPLSGFNPTVGNSLGALNALLGLYSGIQNENPIGMAGGAIGTASNLANMAGFSGAGGAIGALGGPLSLYAGIQNEDPMGIASGALGTYNSLAGMAFPQYSLGTLASEALSALAPEAAASLGLGGGATLGGAGATAGSMGGAVGASGAMGGATGAGTAAGSLGASLGAGVVAAPIIVGMITDMLYKSGILFPGDKSTTQTDISEYIGDFAEARRDDTIGQRDTLPGLAALLGQQFSPHGEVQMGSAPEFGWQGDHDDPMSANWRTALQLLSNPDYINAGEGAAWVDPFVRGLWSQSGNTGNVTEDNASAVWQMQEKLASALPDLPAYQALRAAVAPGGDMYNTEAQRIHDYTTALYNRPNPYNLPFMNTFDPYSGTGTMPDGTTFKFSNSALQESMINPYTYHPEISIYGYPQDASVQSGTEGGGGGQGGMNPGTWQAPTNLPTWAPATPYQSKRAPSTPRRPVPQNEQARVQAMLPPQDALGGMGLLRGMLPQFNAQGADDPMTMLRQWAQYGGVS